MSSQMVLSGQAAPPADPAPPPPAEEAGAFTTEIGPAGGWQLLNVRELWQFRELIYLLVWRDVSSHARKRYQGHERCPVAVETHGSGAAAYPTCRPGRAIKPLALDRLSALVEPAMEEARVGSYTGAFARLEAEVRALAATPSGVGLDVPEWLRRLAMEVQAVRAARATSEQFGDGLFEMPHHMLGLEDVRQQMEEWERPLGPQ